MVRSYKDLEAYKVSYALAMDLFWVTQRFPKEELHSLTTPARHAARTIAADLVEGWVKRHAEPSFRKHLLDAISSCEQTRHWIDLAGDCRYLETGDYALLQNRCDEVMKSLRTLYDNWRSISR